jgi:hypothetical protein
MMNFEWKRKRKNAERALASMEKPGAALTGMAPRSGAILNFEF